MPANIVPTEIKKLKGTLNVTKALKSEMHVNVENDLPPAPNTLGEKGREQWDLTVLELMRNNILTKVDQNHIMTYCVAVDVMWDSARKMKELGLTGPNGNGIETKALHFTAFLDSVNTMNKVGPLIGITPAGRTKISAKPAEKKSPLQAILDRKIG